VILLDLFCLALVLAPIVAFTFAIEDAGRTEGGSSE
jgi:hypothetical protein